MIEVKLGKDIITRGSAIAEKPGVSGILYTRGQ